MSRDPAADAAFTEFATASRTRVRNTAYLLCGDWDQAVDHVQEGLIRVYVAWPRLVRGGGELAYTRKAVVSAFLDASRKRSSHERATDVSSARASDVDVATAVTDRNCGTLGIHHDNWFQIFTADGDPVVTVRDDGIDAATVSNDAVTLNDPAAGEHSGSYVYDFDSGRLLRVSDTASDLSLGGEASGDFFLWNTPVDDDHDAAQWLGELL